jgi:hypothetical protein
MRRVSWGALIAICAAVSAGPAMPVLADCMDSCMAGYGCGNEYEASRIESGSYCRTQQGGCEAQCNRKSAKTYGAIAYSRKNGAYGWSKSYDDKKGADGTALANCAKNSDDCEVVATFANSCAALAAGDHSVVRWKTAASKEEAGDAAVKACADAGGGNACHVQVSACSLP